jgi:hypothetical protein
VTSPIRRNASRVYGSDIGAERLPVDVTPRDDAAAQM